MWPRPLVAVLVAAAGVPGSQGVSDSLGQGQATALVSREVSLGSPPVLDWSRFVPYVTHDRSRAAWLTGPKVRDLVVDGAWCKGSGDLRDAVFSPDGKRFGYVSDRGSHAVVIVDGVEGDRHDWACCLAFSPNGERVAFVATRSGKTALLVDGKAGKPFKEIRHPTFSPDGSRVAYLARSDRLWSVVVDDVAGKGYDQILSAPEFSPDGTRVAFLTKQGGRLIPVIDGSEISQYDSTGMPRFSPDGKRVAFAASRGVPSLSVNETPGPGGSFLKFGRGSVTRWFPVVDGTPGGEYYGREILGDVGFSPDGQHVAFIGSRGQNEFVVLDGVEQTVYDDVHSVRFSPDSRRLAYIAVRRGKSVAVIDGVEGKEYDGAGGLAFSPDSQVVAYAARSAGGAFAVVGTTEGQRYEVVETPRFSPDGRHVAYRAGKKGVWRIVVDGIESREYADVYSYVGVIAASRLRVNLHSGMGREDSDPSPADLGFVFVRPNVLRGIVAVKSGGWREREILRVELEVPAGQ